MKEEIKHHLDNPQKLEALYRAQKSSFKEAFNELYPSLSTHQAAAYWHARLNFEKEELPWGSKWEWWWLALSCLLAGVLAKLPDLLSVDQDVYYSRYLGFFLFPMLAIYFIRKNRLSGVKKLILALVFVGSATHISFLPADTDTTILASIHLVLFLWSLTGITYVGNLVNQNPPRLGFLKFNGDLVVMSALMLIAGLIMSAITIGLFEVTGINIENFYFDHVVVFALPSVPLIATFLIQLNPQLVGKVSPVIARIFSPLVLIMLVIYLAAMVYTGQNPYEDRDFLMIFNVLLIGVMALIFFSVAENNRNSRPKPESWVLMLLSLVTIVVNVIAVSAILFRISEMGLTPNRLAVLGGNILILINLVLVAVQLFRFLVGKAPQESIGKVIAVYLPVYISWTIIVTFIFPVLFSYQ